MSLKKFSQLSEKEKMEVYRRYTDTSMLDMYLYNFDDKGNYINRQYNPEGLSLVNESVQNNEAGKKILSKEEKEFMTSKEVENFHGKLEEAKKKSRRTKK